MVCYCSVPDGSPQPDISVLHSAHSASQACPAKAMKPPQRRQLALEALAGTETVSRLAGEHAVSRKFVYRQAAKAEEALDAAFSLADCDEEKVFFHLPVTKAWLRQLIFGLTLICHSSLRGVVELFGDVFDCSISVGTVHNVLQSAVEQARSYNRQQDLSGVRIGAHDEIFQSGRPVLEVACRGDVFHALQTVQSLVTFLENRAYAVIGTSVDLQRKKARLEWRGRPTQGLAVKFGHARREGGRKTGRSPWPATWPRC